MLFENSVFIPATRDLLRSFENYPERNDVFHAAYEKTGFYNVSPEFFTCPVVATEAEWTVEFYPFYNKLPHPVDALIAIVDEDDEIIGWHVVVWYNEDDDDYYYEEYHEDDDGEDWN
jgi:hypothetical protein